MKTTENDTTYNGWTNYETWNAKLWMDNEESSQRNAEETAQDCWDNATAGGIVKSFTRLDNATADLRERLKSEFEESMPDLGASVFADLLQSAVGEINWHEIAESILGNIDQTEDEETEEDD